DLGRRGGGRALVLAAVGGVAVGVGVAGHAAAGAAHRVHAGAEQVDGGVVAGHAALAAVVGVVLQLGRIDVVDDAVAVVVDAVAALGHRHAGPAGLAAAEIGQGRRSEVGAGQIAAAVAAAAGGAPARLPAVEA